MFWKSKKQKQIEELQDMVKYWRDHSNLYLSKYKKVAKELESVRHKVPLRSNETGRFISKSNS